MQSSRAAIDERDDRPAPAQVLTHFVRIRMPRSADPSPRFRSLGQNVGEDAAAAGIEAGREVLGYGFGVAPIPEDHGESGPTAKKLALGHERHVQGRCRIHRLGAIAGGGSFRSSACVTERPSHDERRAETGDSHDDRHARGSVGQENQDQQDDDDRRCGDDDGIAARQLGLRMRRSGRQRLEFASRERGSVAPSTREIDARGACDAHHFRTLEKPRHVISARVLGVDLPRNRCVDVRRRDDAFRCGPILRNGSGLGLLCGSGIHEQCPAQSR